jgi:putative membrane protein
MLRFRKTRDVENWRDPIVKSNTTEFLAVERTRMANQRTLLAYVRTSLAFLLLGLGIIKFYPHKYIFILGGLGIACSTVIFVIGVFQFWRTQNKLSQCVRNIKED